MTKVSHFHVLTDAELAGICGSGPISREDLLVRYRELRDHHVAETEALTRRDRSAILRMAGNIAGGLFADPSFEADTAKEVAEKAVRVARAIVTEVDR